MPDAADPTADLIEERPATPGDVLEVLRDCYRHDPLSDVDDVTPELLTEEVRLSAWQFHTGRREPWRIVAAALNGGRGVAVTEAEWRTLVEPRTERTVGEVCASLAARAVRPVVKPAEIAATACTKAGAFLTLRALLTNAGLSPGDADRIGPATELTDYGRRFPHVFLKDVLRLAPGLFPNEVEEDERDGRYSARDVVLVAAFMPVICAGPAALVAGIMTGVVPLLVAGCLLTLVQTLLFGSLGEGEAEADSLPDEVRFGGLRTFRDLAEAMTEPRPTRGVHPPGPMSAANRAPAPIT